MKKRVAFVKSFQIFLSFSNVPAVYGLTMLLCSFSVPSIEGFIYHPACVVEDDGSQREDTGPCVLFLYISTILSECVLYSPGRPKGCPCRCCRRPR